MGSFHNWQTYQGCKDGAALCSEGIGFLTHRVGFINLTSPFVRCLVSGPWCHGHFVVVGKPIIECSIQSL
ncbi:hypothetical protein XENTR_v10007227 [Xenopus tropicalis]|nr:hypothetical protein XENTR_v10007227 [Xenopus tropicalis]